VRVEFRGIACGSGVSHVGELIALRWLSVLDLVEKSRSDWTIENEVAIEKLHFLDSLPATNHGRRSRTGRRGLVGKWVLGIRTIRVLGAQHALAFILPVPDILILWGRFIWLVVVGIMMVIIMVAWAGGILLIVLIVVTVRVI